MKTDGQERGEGTKRRIFVAAFHELNLSHTVNVIMLQIAAYRETD